jgi:hypothetical protein
VEEVRPDVILCDVVMPDLNGYEVCQTLKADPATLHLPVVLLTGTFEPFDRDRAIASGCDAIVTKPFEGRELITVVEDLLQRSRGPHIAEPEPSFFPGFGAPEGLPGLEYSTTGFEHMVPVPQPEPSVPEHGLEISGIGAPTEAPAEEPAFAEGQDATRPSAGVEPPSDKAEDSWISRMDTEPPQVGAMQGEFFEEPISAAVSPLDEPDIAGSEAEEVVPVLPPWQESAELQARAAAQELEQPPAAEVTGGFRELTEDDFASGESAFPEAPDGLIRPGEPATWEQLDAADEPEVGLWPPLPPPEPALAILPPLTPIRESIASAWDAQAVADAAPQPFLPEDEIVHPEPGFPFGGQIAAAEPAEEALMAVPEPPAGEEFAVAEPSTEEPAPASADQPARAAQPEVSEQPEVIAEAVPETEAEPEAFVAAEAATAPDAPAPGVITQPPVAPEIPAEPTWEAQSESVPEPEPATEPEFAAAPEPEPQAEVEFEPPALLVDEAESQAVEAVAAPLLGSEPIAEEPPPVPALPEEPGQPDAPALEAMPAAELTPPEPSEELIEQIAERVMSRIALPAERELSEDQLTLVASRAVQLIPPPPPPELPPLSYELEENDIQRVALRIMDMLPPPAPTPFPEDAVELVAQRAAQLLTAPLPQPIVVPEGEIDRVTQRVLESFPPQPAPRLGEEDLARIAERVAILLPSPTAAPASAPDELSEAAVEQIARKVIELSQPLFERIAWEVIPDMAEMLVRRRIAELEKEAES